MHLAELRVRELQLLPNSVRFKWLQYDDRCDASYATISAMDGYGIGCAHVLFGPACDYALGERPFTQNNTYRTSDMNNEYEPQ